MHSPSIGRRGPTRSASHLGRCSPTTAGSATVCGSISAIPGRLRQNRPLPRWAGSFADSPTACKDPCGRSDSDRWLIRSCFCSSDPGAQNSSRSKRGMLQKSILAGLRFRPWCRCMICLKHCVLIAFPAIGANCRKAINRAESGMSRNATQLTEIASRLAESDHLDNLTGVENRNHFHDHLEQMLQREGGENALLTKCNVSRFHHINTSFGYDVGDALLIQVGQRLRTLPDAVIGRLSGDEFAVALPLSDPDLSKATVVRIRELLAPKFVLPGATIDVRFSIGYAVGRVRDDSIGLLRKAGIALHESKR